MFTMRAKPRVTPTPTPIASVTSPRRTSRYRALRRSSTGISIARCFTTVYPSEIGMAKSAVIAPTQKMNGSSCGWISKMPARICSVMIGIRPTSIPSRITRLFRRTSGGPKAFSPSETIASTKKRTEYVPITVSVEIACPEVRSSNHISGYEPCHSKTHGGEDHRHQAHHDDGRPLQPRHSAVERRVCREDAEEGVRHRGQRRREQRPERERRPAQELGQHELEIRDGRLADEAAEHQRKEPGMRVVWPLQQDHGRDNQERQRIEAEHLREEPREMEPRPGAGEPGRHVRANAGREHDVAGRAVVPDRETHGDAWLRVAAQREVRRLRLERLAVDRRDEIARPDARMKRGAIGADVVDHERARRGPQMRFHPERDRRQVADHVHPLHAVRRQQRNEQEGRRPGREHGSSLLRVVGWLSVADCGLRIVGPDFSPANNCLLPTAYCLLPVARNERRPGLQC